MSDKFNLVRAEMNEAALLEWAKSREMLRRGRVQDEGFMLHCLLREVFGEAMPRPFKYMRTRRSRGYRRGAARSATLFGYADLNAEELSNSMKRFACPLQIAAMPPEDIQTKEMPDNFYEGDRLGFEVTVRPVMRLPNETGRRIEVDAFVVAGNVATAKGEPKREREEVYIHYLTRRMEASRAAIIEDMRMEFCELLPAVRKRGNKPSIGPHVLMRGALRVGNEEKFSKMLRSGVGRHKSYGYGMLFLRPM